MNQVSLYQIPEYRVQMVADRHVPFEKRPKITTAADAVPIFREMITPDELHFREHMVMLMLNPTARVIGSYRLSTGGVCSTILDVRVVAQAALSCMASSVIICHNHPSGNINSSKADDALTKKLKKALETLDIILLDHIILTAEDFYSYKNDSKL